mmetsp:Transcript_101110/g.240991  ORF Transcript_101110/g.240991 Transcript_101110/m.240991 type:complete len:287 (-) Transcript_101110:140-1000(-)
MRRVGGDQGVHSPNEGHGQNHRQVVGGDLGDLRVGGRAQHLRHVETEALHRFLDSFRRAPRGILTLWPTFEGKPPGQAPDEHHRHCRRQGRGPDFSEEARQRHAQGQQAEVAHIEAADDLANAKVGKAEPRQRHHQTACRSHFHDQWPGKAAHGRNEAAHHVGHAAHFPGVENPLFHAHTLACSLLCRLGNDAEDEGKGGRSVDPIGQGAHVGGLLLLHHPVGHPSVVCVAKDHGHTHTGNDLGVNHVLHKAIHVVFVHPWCIFVGCCHHLLQANGERCQVADHLA